MKNLFDSGSVLRSKFYTCFYCKNCLSLSRVGIVIKKAIGCSVKRNYEKRIIREFFRINKSGLNNDYDLLILVKNKFGLFTEKRNDFEELIYNIQKNETK